MQTVSPKRDGVVVAVANQKGGVGKSTTTIHLAVGLSLKGKRVLVIDCDPQCNTSSIFYPNHEELPDELTLYQSLINKAELPIITTRYKNVDMVVSRLLLSETDLILGKDQGLRHARLAKQISLVRNQYDYIFLDCPPSLTLITINAFFASDRLIVVVQPEKFSLEGIPQLSKTITFVQDEFDHYIELRGFLLNMADSRTKIFHEVKNSLKEAFGSKVYYSFFPYRTAVKDLLNEDIPKTMFETSNNDFAAAVNNFIKEEFGI